MLRVAFVPGVSPDKWFRRWVERHPRTPIEAVPVRVEEQREVLFDGRADLCFVRPPADLPGFKDGLHLIPLYLETAVVIAPKDHAATVFDELLLADLAEETMLDASSVPGHSGTEALLDLVAAGVGLYLLPQSEARHFNRKELRFRPVTDAPEYPVGIAWRQEREEPELEEFIGIVRGRTANSSRDAQAVPVPKQPARKPPARQSSTAAKRKPQNQARRRPGKRR
ncbi:LysR substrate-binding domain-containing protein [Arthrobacter russicus]|uniref:DNA-binding transcriptional LysR family regulator n=1 Tax=Arthrobacter russicus TaxID=172040 RepID=A0ABU1JB57_9MICC|nr:LysR substrate-binding domain-containing protein [Arthrobacter russicus]MDR6269662.1 DNA-binding transcriptional LysR family regulator [Arthrobacter russicus]